MNEWLEILIMLSVVGSTSVACILVVNPISQKRFSANWHYSIRKLAVFFYLVPVIFMVGMFPTVSPNSVSPFGIVDTYYWGEILPGKSISMIVAVGILSIWGVGAVIFGGWQLYCYSKFTKDILKKTIPIADDSDVYKLLTSSKKMLGVKGKVKLAYNVTIASPALVGLLKPTILLPIRKMSAAELDMVIHHELIHFKRKDLWVKLVVLVASALHWFNPFVYILRKEVHIWSELACDEKVITNMSYVERKRYGEMILNMLEDSLTRRPISYSVLLSGSKKNLERRLTMLIDTKKVKRPVVVIAATVMLAIGAIGTTAGALAMKNIPAVESGEEKGAIFDPNYETDVAIFNPNDQKAEEAVGRSSKLLAVSRSDEERFKPEVWQQILADIEKGEVYWEESREWKRILSKIDKGELSWEDL